MCLCRSKIRDEHPPNIEAQAKTQTLQLQWLKFQHPKNHPSPQHETTHDSIRQLTSPSIRSLGSPSKIWSHSSGNETPSWLTRPDLPCKFLIRHVHSTWVLSEKVFMHTLCTLVSANQKLCSDPFSLELTLLGQQSTQLAFPFPAGTEDRAPSNPGFWFTGDRDGDQGEGLQEPYHEAPLIGLYQHKRDAVPFIGSSCGWNILHLSSFCIC